MIYGTRERAEAVARELNKRLGHPPARATITPHGWTVIASWKK